MKIYIAARYSRREEMEKVANYLKSKGLEITARWVYGGEEGLTRTDIANLDFDDVKAADVILAFTEPYGSLNVGGGRHWEVGAGYALGKTVTLIGPREIVFHHFENIFSFEDVDLFLDFINAE